MSAPQQGVLHLGRQNPRMSGFEGQQACIWNPEGCRTQSQLLKGTCEISHALGSRQRQQLKET